MAAEWLIGVFIPAHGIMSDPFDSILNLEETFLAEGAEEGRRDGQRSGLEEGKLVGLGRGHDMGHELGYFYGCLLAWQALPAEKLNEIPARFANISLLCSLWPFILNQIIRTLKMMKKLVSELEQFNFDATDDDLVQRATAIRSKYKAVSAYFDQDARSSKDSPKAADLSF